MLITEFRITMPMTVEEYQVGMLYEVAKTSCEETGGGEGVEVLANEPYKDHPLMNGNMFSEGQYTHKVYHLESKVPNIIKMIAPKGSLQLKEEAWNASKYCRTIITNPSYMKESFILKLETFCIGDRGESENVHNLNADQLALRKVVHINIGDEANLPNKATPLYPSRTMITKCDPTRGPLGKDWQTSANPVMTVYKLVTIEFKWFGLQSSVESFLMGYEERLFNQFHRKIYCSMNDWFGMTLDDIRALEDKTKQDLEEQRLKGEKRGTDVIE